MRDDSQRLSANNAYPLHSRGIRSFYLRQQRILRAGTRLLQNDRKTQSSVESAGAGAGRAALARADANDSMHADGRGAMGLETARHGSSSAIESKANMAGKRRGHAVRLKRCEMNRLGIVVRLHPRESSSMLIPLTVSLMLLTQMLLLSRQHSAFHQRSKAQAALTADLALLLLTWRRI